MHTVVETVPYLVQARRASSMSTNKNALLTRYRSIGAAALSFPAPAVFASCAFPRVDAEKAAVHV
jgi:hypothetical protein